MAETGGFTVLRTPSGPHGYGEMVSLAVWRERMQSAEERERAEYERLRAKFGTGA